MGQAAQLAEVADALRTTAGVYTNTGDGLDETTIFLTAVVQDLFASWEGASSTAFVNACNRAWNDEDKVSTSLNTTASALTALASVIEDNISAISSYETDSASTTIKPQELMAAQNASNMALEAITGAVAEQAAAVNAAAAQVGVCSIGEGGPWDADGLNETNFAKRWDPRIDGGKIKLFGGESYRTGSGASAWMIRILTALAAGIINYIVPTRVSKIFTPTEGISSAGISGILATVGGSFFDFPEIFAVATGVSALGQIGAALVVKGLGIGSPGTSSTTTKTLPDGEEEVIVKTPQGTWTIVQTPQGPKTTFTPLPPPTPASTEPSTTPPPASTPPAPTQGGGGIYPHGK